MRSVLASKMTFLVLIFCFSLFFSTKVEGDPKDKSKNLQQKTKVVKKQSKSKTSQQKTKVVKKQSKSKTSQQKTKVVKKQSKSKTSQQKTKVVKKQNKSKNSKMSCPQKVNQATAKKLITAWMQAEMWGHTRPTVAKKSCLDKKTQYRLMLPKPQRDVGTPSTSMMASQWKLLSLKRVGESKFSTDYIANIRIAGKIKNKASSFSQKMLFGFPKGMEAKAFGCVMLHSSWKKDFITKQCLK